MTAEFEQEPSRWNRRFERALTAYFGGARDGSAPNARALIEADPDLAEPLAECAALDGKLRGRIARISSPAPPPEEDAGPAPAARPSSPPPLPPGWTIGDYEILDVLGRGGMAIVYRARQLSLNRLVALKILTETADAGLEAQSRFQREAEAVARLDHPNIVPVYEAGEHDGLRYFSMKLIEGPSLNARARDDRDDPREAARIVAIVARAIHHAHEKGILHRDLTPANILIDKTGAPMVVDFGLSRQVDVDTALTLPGWAPGTPPYMAPEQVSGDRDMVGPATDVYALGAVLYFLLTGQPPFQGETKEGVLRRVLHDPPAPPRSVREPIDEGLETICLKCLEKDQSARFRSARALADDLERWLAGRPIVARRPTRFDRAWRRARRHPRTSALVFLLIALPAAFGGFFGLGIREQARLERQAALMANRAAAERASLDLATAWRYWDENQPEPARQLLDRHRPGPHAPDRRSYPWRLLDRLVRTSGRTLLGHQGPVYCAVFSPDGKALVTAGQDGKIRSWDAASGAPLSAIDAHSNEVNSLAFSPDGRLLVTASEDATVKIWDVATSNRRLLKTLSGHADEVVSALFAADGRRLITGARQGKVAVWNTADWRETGSFSAPNAPRLQGLALSPDSSMLAVAGDRGTYVVNVLDRQKLAWLGPKDGQANCAVFSPDGRFLAEARAQSSLRVWNVHDWTIAANVPVPDGGVEGGLKGVAFAPDLRTVAAIGELGMVHLVDWNTLAQDTIATGQEKSWCVAFSPDGRTLATTSNDATVKLWSVPRDGTHIAANVPFRSRITVAFSADGEELTFADARGHVWSCSARDGHLKRSLSLEAGTGPPIVATALALDARRLVGVTDSGEYWAWDLETVPNRPGAVPILRGTTAGPAVPPVPPGEMGPSPSSGQFRDGVSLGAGPSAAPHWDWFAASPDGRWIAGPDFGVELLPTRANRGQPARHITIRYFDIRDVFFSPTSAVFSVLHERMNGPLLYDIAARRIRRPTTAIHHDPIVAQAFSRDGLRLATGTERGTIVVWDVATLEPLAELLGPTTKIVALAFSPGGRTLAVGQEDHCVSLWDVPTRRRLTSLRGHSGPVWLVRFSPSGDTLATCATGADGNIQLFLWPAMSSR